jgi:tRNA (guanine37-N1)-methyltransferase
MRIDAVTIFPEYLAPLRLSLLGRACEAGLVEVAVHDLRDFTHDRHRTVDDTPAGGGAGMVMRPEPWGEALDAVRALGPAGVAPTLIVPSPAGSLLTQPLARELAARPWLVFACGRYEGIDERVLDDAATRGPVLPVSIGDYVLAGGESAVLVIVEAVTRLLPGVLGNAESLLEESHEGGLLEYPVYTKPATWRGLPVPEVLASGHHARIAAWRRGQRLLRTADRRPELWHAWLAEHGAELTAAERAELGLPPG